MFVYLALGKVTPNIPLCDKAMKNNKSVILTQQLTKEINDNEGPTTLILDPYWNNRGFTLVDILHQDEDKQETDIEITTMKLITLDSNLSNQTNDNIHEPTFTKHFIGPYTFSHRDAYFCLNRGLDVPIRPCKGIYIKLFFIPFVSEKFRNGNYFAICDGNTCLKRKKFKKYKERQYRVSYETVSDYGQLNDERYLFQFFEPENFINKIRNIGVPAISGFKGCDGTSDSLFKRVSAVNHEADEKPFRKPNVPPEETTKGKPDTVAPKLESMNKNIEALSNKLEVLNEKITSPFEPQLVEKSNEAIQKLKLLNTNDNKILEKLDKLSTILQIIQNSGNTSLEKLDDIICGISSLTKKGDTNLSDIKTIQESNLQVPKQILKLTNFINNIDSNIKSVIENTNTLNKDMRTYKNVLEGINLKQEECNSACEKGITEYLKSNNFCIQNCSKNEEKLAQKELEESSCEGNRSPVVTKSMKEKQFHINKPCDLAIERETIVVTKTISNGVPDKSIYHPKGCDSNAVRRTACLRINDIPKMYLHTTSNGPSLSDWRNVSRG